MKKSMMAAVAVLVLAPVMGAMAQESKWAIDPLHSQAGFEIRHMGISNVRGTIGGIKGEIIWDEKNVSKDSVVADLDMNTVSTQADARDKHLKSPDFFDVAKYPTMHFQSTSVSRDGAGKLKVAGNLTISGVTKPVVLDVDGPVPPQKGMKGTPVSGFSASTTIKRADFNIGQKFAPPMVGDEVKITIDVEMDKL